MIRDIHLLLFTYWYFTVPLMVLNLFVVYPLAVKILIYFNRHSIEGLGNRRLKSSVSFGLKQRIRLTLVKYDKGEIKSDYYDKLKLKVRKSGYKSVFAPLLYLFFKYIFPVILFFAVLPANYPDIIRPLFVSLFMYASTNIVMDTKKRSLNMRFRRYIYKIYRYLHNQISSGVSISDAIKTVYKVVHDKQIQYSLIELAARYELTSNIDYALEVFTESFDSEEIETLCLAIKQGIETGDNKDLLLRQERFMFSKYFSYIQAETDRSSLKSLASALMFIITLVVMISIPLIQEGSEGLSNIFIN